METMLEVFERAVKGELALLKGEMEGKRTREDKARFVKYHIENLEQTLAMAKFQKVVAKDYEVKIGGLTIK